MTPPRWFYPLVGACLVVLTAAGVWRMRTAGRYAPVNEVGVLDTHTGRECYPVMGKAGGVVCYDLNKPAAPEAVETDSIDPDFLKAVQEDEARQRDSAMTANPSADLKDR